MRKNVARRDEREEGDSYSVAAAALRLPPRALRVGGRIGRAGSDGRPLPRFTTGDAEAAGGGAGAVGSTVVAGSSAACRSMTLPERRGRRVMVSPVSSSTSWSPVTRPSFWRRAAGRASQPSYLSRTVVMVALRAQGLRDGHRTHATGAAQAACTRVPGAVRAGRPWARTAPS